jgi:hypothetical protein
VWRFTILQNTETKRTKRAQAGRLAGIVKKTHSGRDKTRPTTRKGDKIKDSKERRRRGKNDGIFDKRKAV